MCICHLPCHPVKPNLVGEQVKNAVSLGNGYFGGNFCDLLSFKIHLAIQCKFISPECKYLRCWMCLCSSPACGVCRASAEGGSRGIT